MKKEKIISLSLLVQFLIFCNIIIFKDVLIANFLISLTILAISILVVSETLKLIEQK